MGDGRAISSLQRPGLATATSHGQKCSLYVQYCRRHTNRSLEGWTSACFQGLTRGDGTRAGFLSVVILFIVLIVHNKLCCE